MTMNFTRKLLLISVSVYYVSFLNLNLFRFLLSLDEVLKSLLDHTEMMKTFIYTVSTGSIQIFKLLIELLEPESLRMPVTNDLNFMFNADKHISKTLKFDTSYSLLHYC